MLSTVKRVWFSVFFFALRQTGNNLRRKFHRLLCAHTKWSKLVGKSIVMQKIASIWTFFYWINKMSLIWVESVICQSYSIRLDAEQTMEASKWAYVCYIMFVWFKEHIKITPLNRFLVDVAMENTHLLFRACHCDKYLCALIMCVARCVVKMWCFRVGGKCFI